MEIDMTDHVREALAELVRLQDLRDRADKISPVEPGCEKEVLMDLWRQGLRPAWAKARAALAQPAPQPLTDERIIDLWEEHMRTRALPDYKAFARAVLAAQEKP
jgi:hypothetical protein